MVVLNFITILFIWVVIGVWISFKRNWYKHRAKEMTENAIFFNIIFSPICLILAGFNEFILKKWKNEI